MSEFLHEVVAKREQPTNRFISSVFNRLIEEQLYGVYASLAREQDAWRETRIQEARANGASTVIFPRSNGQAEVVHLV